MYNNINRFNKQVREDSLSAYMDRLTFQLNGFGRFAQQEISSYSQFFSSDIELILIVKGHSILHTPNEKFHLLPGSLVLLKPYRIYTAICQPGEKMYYYYIHFSVQPAHMLDSYLELVSGDGEALTVPPDCLPDFAPFFNDMLGDWKNETPGLKTLLLSYLSILSVHLARFVSAHEPLTRTAQDPHADLELISKALDYITAHLSEPLRQEDICNHLSISASGLYKLFRRILHVSPSAYITKTRLQQAEILLRTTGCTIDEAAKQCGFCSASHLSRRFKDSCGLSPSAYFKENNEPTK